MTKNGKKIVEESKLEECSEVERNSQIKSLETSDKIWIALESNFEGSKHAKRIRL